MADYDSSLPVRTEVNNATGSDMQVAIADGANGAQLWNIDANGIGQVNINDGTNALVVGSNGELTTIVTDGTDTIAIDGSGNLSTIITDGTTPMSVNLDGSINVNVVSSVSGGEVHDYGTSAAVAPNTPTTVTTYTVTVGKTFRIMSFQAAASGAFKAELKVNAVVVATVFGSTAGGSVETVFPQPIEAAAGQVVLVEMTNRDKSNTDLYAFINGVEV